MGESSREPWPGRDGDQMSEIRAPEREKPEADEQEFGSEPTWDVARLFPPRGEWTESEYLLLPSNRAVELSDGCLEVLPMPTEAHQLLVLFLYEALASFVRARTLGMVLVAAHPVRLWAGKMREPDVLFMRAENAHRRTGQFWEGADLVMEVVSSQGRERDLETKRDEYARGGIPEYWIVDPAGRQVTVLSLENGVYREHGQFQVGDTATSALLPGFVVSVADLFALSDTG